MGRYPKLIKLVLNLIDRVDTLAPWLAPRRQAWSQKDKQLDALYQGWKHLLRDGEGTLANADGLVRH